ncbi:MAG: phage tail protein [Lachnospiraceae bacterium]|nr:phage tail protein [Lachnospiraceae bacterium]
MSDKLFTASRFQVSMSGSGYIKDGEPVPVDASFAECSGIKVINHIVRVRSGSDERGVQGVIPSIVEYGNLTLSRGASDSYRFLDWVFACMPTFEKGPAKPERKTIQITVLDDKQKPGIVWRLYGAYPVSYSLGAMNAQGNNVLLESIEFAYSGLGRSDPPPEAENMPAAPAAGTTRR